MNNAVKNNIIPDELNLALQIDRLPVATPDMTEEELREVVVSFKYLQHHFAYTPDLGGIGSYGYHIKNLSSRYNASKDPDNIKIKFEEGKHYGGVPYMGNSAGSLYRWLEFYDADTGVMDWAPLLRTKRINWVDNHTGKIYPDVGSSYFGNTCSSSCVWSWLRVSNSIDSFWTYTCIPKHGFVKVGDYELDENDTYGSSTKELCQKNGKSRMFAAYAEIKKADGMVKSGHAVMCVSNAVVAYDENGEIDGEKSYVLIGEQTAGFLTAPPDDGGVERYSPLNDKGDTYRIQGNYSGDIVNGDVWDMKWSFDDLFRMGYMPFTVKELCGMKKVDASEVELLLSDEVYAADQIKADNLKQMRIKSNYAISDTHFIIIDESGHEVFSAMYAALTEDIDRVSPVTSLKNYSVHTALLENVIYPDKEYINKNIQNYATNGGHTLKITARISTGEVLTVYEGALIK
jgi:hypothetical protein